MWHYFPSKPQQLSQHCRETQYDSKHMLLMMSLLHLFNAQIDNKYRLKKGYCTTYLIMQTKRKGMQAEGIIMHEAKERVYGLK
jgi:hypothetical protein